MKLIKPNDLYDFRRAADLSAILFSGLISRIVVEGFSLPDPVLLAILLGSLVQFLVFIPVMIRERFWRNVSADETVRFGERALFCCMLFLVANLVYSHELNWSAWIFVNALTTMATLCGMRIARRTLFEFQSQRLNRLLGRPALVYGTGSAARSLAARFSTDPTLGIRLIGFVDDDPAQAGRREKGVPVLGTGADIPRLLKKHAIQELILAKPMMDGSQLGTILQEAHRLNVKPKILTELGLTNSREERSEVFRDINLQDLLQRERVDVDLKSTLPLIAGRVVLVSGAGGSIGSELIRQIAKMNPSKIIALDHSEYNLYEIESEMKRIGFSSMLVPILSDLKEPKILAHLLDQYRPECFFHAAAYKHVHLVENNSNSSIINNLLTLKNLLDASLRSDVSCFVLISTDKAVNPKGIMGCTKRAGELLVSQAAAQSGKRYCSVRFGNVLGSSGSFIPLLKQQILEGGPVTITHPDMERYFMLIPEAVSLVLKAASISEPGDINVLRMGKSIKIVDIATNLITLLGKSVDSIPVIHTGIRPGEKLREELYLRGDELTTQHPDILVLPRGAQISEGWDPQFNLVGSLVDQIISLAKNDDPGAETLLRSMVELDDGDPLQKSVSEKKGVQSENSQPDPELVA